LGTLAAILSPVIFNLLSYQSGYGMSPHHWNPVWMGVFLGGAGLDLLAMVFYAIFASGEIQTSAVGRHTHQDTSLKMSALSEKGV